MATLGAVFGGIFLTMSMVASIAYSNSTVEGRYPSVIQSIKNSEMKEKELEGRINWINTILKNSSL
jgi:Na+/H+ antiporter NhaA